MNKHALSWLNSTPPCPMTTSRGNLHRRRIA
jgi:hypothetical protein